MTQQINKDTMNPFWNVKISVLIYFVIAFAATTAVAISGITKNLDDLISQFFNVIQNPSIDLIFIIITTTSDTINLVIAGFVLTIIKRTRRFGMILLISLVAITILVTYIKPLLGIEQPQQNFVPLASLPEKFTLERDSFMPFAQEYSYPSNHIASAVAFGFIIGGISYRHSYKFAISFLIAFPIIIGFTKLYLLQHNTIDLIGGYLFGLIVVILIVKGLKANNEIPKDKEMVQVLDTEGEDGVKGEEGNEVGEGVQEVEEIEDIESDRGERVESDRGERVERKLDEESNPEKNVTEKKIWRPENDGKDSHYTEKKTE